MKSGVWGVPLYGPTGLNSMQNKPVLRYGVPVDPNAPVPVQPDEETNRLAETSQNVMNLGNPSTKMASPNQILPTNSASNQSGSTGLEQSYINLKAKFDSTAGVYLRVNYQKLKVSPSRREYEVH